MDRVHAGLRDGMLAMAAFSGVMLVVMQLFGASFAAAFVEEQQVVALGGRALRLTSCFYIFLGTLYATRGTLNGVGDTLFSLISNHAIVDGNKRIGLFVMLSFLEMNGIRIKCTDEELIHVGLSVADGNMGYYLYHAYLLTILCTDPRYCCRACYDEHRKRGKRHDE